MTKDYFKAVRHSSSQISTWIASLTLTAGLLFFSTSPAAAQDPQDQDQDQATQQGQQADRPVISRDTISAPNQAPPPAQRPSSNRPYAQPPAASSLPPSLTIPPGTVIFARINQPLSSDKNHAGDSFTATLDRPIIVDGWVVARRGQTIVGSVTAAQKAGRVKGVSQLGLELTDLSVVDGQQMPILTELWKGSAGTSHGADAAGIATTTGVGTIIGAAADGGAGAGIGAGAGAVAGIAAVLLTRGKPTIIGPEALLTFRLKDPVTISTERSQQAFQPVNQRDYSPSRRDRGDGYAAYPQPYYASCGPYGCSPYYYPYYYGPYYGPTFAFGYYGGYRGFYHRGFHR